MKVKIEVTVDIDVDEWCAQFDVPSLPHVTPTGCVRADVNEYAKSALHATFEHIGVLK